MKKWIPDESCTACATCINICPVDAISFEEDIYGFHVPKINNELCKWWLYLGEEKEVKENE